MSERVRDYESELRRLSEFVQTRHPSGAVKHIGLMEAVPAVMELITEASEWIGRHLKPDDNEPVTAEWWREVFVHDYVAHFAGPFALLRRSDGLIEIGYVKDVLVTVKLLPHIRTRGDLRRLWLALTGKELGS